MGTILKKFPDIKNDYQTALKIQDKEGKNQALEEVNDKLIQGLCIIYAEHYPEETRINGKKMNDKEDQLNQGFERLLVSRDNTAYQLEKKQIFSNSPDTKIKLNRESDMIDLSKSPYKEIIDSYQKEFQEA
ncbi:MAG: hypothetical protein K6E76_02285 [Patescibacteria group bacterium]|nr:hypothetical protein [Patescibacteria group bacterium]